MLPKSHKITRAIFPKHTDPKKVWIGDGLRIQYAHTRTSDTARFAVTVSKKIFASAVKRNQLKRVIFGLIEQNKTLLYRHHGTKFVFFPLKKNGQIVLSLIKKDMLNFLLQLR